MNRIVIDASVAVKWVVAEAGTPDALILRQSARFAAPDLLMAECANILWKKVQRGDLLLEEAGLAARLLQRADIDLWPMGQLLETAMRMAVALNHPAYDCLYLALAAAQNRQFVTADERLLRRLRQEAALPCDALSLAEAAAALGAAPP